MLLQIAFFHSFLWRVVLHCMFTTSSLSIYVDAHVDGFSALTITNSAHSHFLNSGLSHLSPGITQ